MGEDNVIAFRAPEGVEDPLTEPKLRIRTAVKRHPALRAKATPIFTHLS